MKKKLMAWLREIDRVWGFTGKRREVRKTALGWRPGPEWIEDKGPTPSGNKEFYIVIRKGSK